VVPPKGPMSLKALARQATAIGIILIAAVPARAQMPRSATTSLLTMTGIANGASASAQSVGSAGSSTPKSATTSLLTMTGIGAQPSAAQPAAATVAPRRTTTSLLTMTGVAGIAPRPLPLHLTPTQPVAPHPSGGIIR
jgi:hypothetical protein